jgi:hypothetical protein
MTFEDAKKELKQGYLNIKFELADEHAEELFFKYRDDMYKINKTDIDEYLNFLQSKSEFDKAPSECSLVSKNYREQIISHLHPRARMMPPRSYQLGEKDEENTYVEIGPSSEIFTNYFRFQEQYVEIFSERLHRFRGRSSENFQEMKDALYRPLTIKVYNIKETSIKGAIQKSNEIIDNCIFIVSSLKEAPFELLESWPVRKPRGKTPRDFEFGQIFRSPNLPLPKMRLHSILIRFYQQATSTDIPSLKYLAFYQILEFFFLSVSDENLYINLSRKINDLKFKTTPNHLDKIIQEVISHKRENNETEMLKNVITKYLDENDIIEFITEYESFLGKKIYITKRSIFGTEISGTTLNSGHVIGNISKTIKAVRNALVHSSDRYDRNDRYIPYSKEGTELLELELPLIKFLAEKVIIASGTNL